MSKITRIACMEQMRRYKACTTEARHDDDIAYKEYVAKHGHHFTPKLAQWAIGKMKNVSNSEHGKWTVEQVETVMQAHNPSMKFLHKTTIADLAYLANMYYADLFPDVIATETGCIKAAMAIANDPDGYEGEAFCRWRADMQNKGVKVEWEKYV